MCQSCIYLFLCPPTKLECWLGLAWPGLSFLPFIPLLYTLCFKNAQGSFLIIFCLTLLKLSCYSKKATFLSIYKWKYQLGLAWIVFSSLHTSSPYSLLQTYTRHGSFLINFGLTLLKLSCYAIKGHICFSTNWRNSLLVFFVWKWSSGIWMPFVCKMMW